MTERFSNRHDWLNLLEVSGPFLAAPVLREVFPQGLEELDASLAKRLRGAYEEWRDAVDSDDADRDKLHAAWIDEVLRTALEADDQLLKLGKDVSMSVVVLTEHDTTIAPELVFVDPTHGGGMLAPVHVFPPDTDLSASMKFGGLSCSPGDRMALHLRALSVPFGIVTNGERWMLVHAPSGQVATFASWYARIWGQEPSTLRAFTSLLGVRRFFAPAQDRLPALFERSLKYQDEVTDALGNQVRRAIEVLVQALDRADQDRNRELLHDVKSQEFYEAGLTVMMRLVFLLAAEERGLLLLGEPRYDSFYAVSTLRMQLRAESDEILERRHASWSRLLAVFRAVFGGIDHPTLRLPAMGGSLFDPDRFPFLEGRLKGTSWRQHRAEPLPIDDRTVLLLLEAIQTFEGRTLSYRALDVEQIGHVYEGLLERTVARVDDVTLELEAGAQAKDARVTLGELESARLDGSVNVTKLLADRSRRSRPAIEKELAAKVEPQQHARLLSACRGDERLRDRLEPYVRLLRTDPWGYPRVHPKGAFVVVLGADRRETGTHYTPKSLTERIVEETLTPLVFDGPAKGVPRAEWKLKTSEQLLDLKVCDPAMGSGAFLVQACRFLSARLVEAWSIDEAAGSVVDLMGRVHQSHTSIESMPPGTEVRAENARRIVAERCLYGVDLNPLAVELAKLSLWLVTLSKGRPFGFLDHNLRRGDSLLGICRLEQLTELSLDPSATRQGRLFGKAIERAVAEAVELRRKLHEIPIRDIRDVEAMAMLDADVRKKLEAAELLADSFIGVVFAADGADVETRIAALAANADRVVKKEPQAFEELSRRTLADLSKDSARAEARRPLHWPLAFPHVFEGGSGFDAIIGNPPMLGGRRISFRHSDALLAYLKRWLRGPAGTTDLCVYFLLQAALVVGKPGFIGLVLSDIVAQGESRTNGLERLLAEGLTVYSCVGSRSWPGAAGVKIAHVHLTNADWTGKITIDGVQVEGRISSFLQLEAEHKIETPRGLVENEGLAFSGHYLMGQGFVVSDGEASHLRGLRASNVDVLFPLIRGDDINNTVELTSGNYAINFSMRSLEECQRNYPECLEIVRATVKPERDLVKRKANKERWWRYAEARPGLEGAARHLDQVIVLPFTAKYIFPTFVSARSVFAHPIVVVVRPSAELYACLQSSVHELWVWQFCSTNLDLLRYTATTVLSTFPFPVPTDDLKRAGVDYYAYRQKLINDRGVGLTDIYNLFHAEDEMSPDILQLRRFHEQLNVTVIAAYGWADVPANMGFFPVERFPKGKNFRFTLPDTTRRELLHRLIRLNLLRFERGADSGTALTRAQSAKERANVPDGQGTLTFVDMPEPAAKTETTAPAGKASTRRTRQ
ncbi:Eco57I restriction-modification methylase domain-containing protein [Tahibacter sp. UC22_41]|uniref:Eco57I restriction-modification methylase domain-containing protein n=1 Tax=Tahibacter sp. UC22_41 TaxID=3350178 RepID=UPI0036D90BDC